MYLEAVENPALCSCLSTVLQGLQLAPVCNAKGQSGWVSNQSWGGWGSAVRIGVCVSSIYSCSLRP